MTCATSPLTYCFDFSIIWSIANCINFLQQGGVGPPGKNGKPGSRGPPVRSYVASRMKLKIRLFSGTIIWCNICK